MLQHVQKHQSHHAYLMELLGEKGQILAIPLREGRSSTAPLSRDEFMATAVLFRNAGAVHDSGPFHQLPSTACRT